ncbi:MAG: hypothetical protein ACLFTK_07735 [Anaerolineales bacterium]
MRRPFVRYVVLAGLVLLLALASLPAAAQDTPEPVREAAIRDLQNRIPSIGRPVNWSHTILNNVDNTALGCGLLDSSAASEIQPTNVYVVSLNYPNTTYIYHVLPNGQTLTPCDAQLLGAAQPTPAVQPPAQTGTCTAPTPIRANTQAEVVFSVALRAQAQDDAAILRTLSPGQIITVLTDTICVGNQFWRQVTVDGTDAATGFVLEYDPDLDFFPLTTAGAATPANAAVDTDYVSQTCPANFQGYAPPRLALGMTAFVESGGVNNIIREDYGRSSTSTGVEMPPGASFTVVGGPECTGNPGERIVWWQVSYNGTVGWTAESLNDEYFLRPPDAPLSSGSSAPTAPASPGLALEDAPRVGVEAAVTPLNRTNAGNLSRLGQMIFPGNATRVDLTNDGTMAVYAADIDLNALIVYEGANSQNIVPEQIRNLGPQDQFYVLSRNGQGYAAIRPRQFGGGDDLGVYEIISGDLVFDIPEPEGVAVNAVAIDFADNGHAFSYAGNNPDAGIFGAQIYFRGQNVVRDLGVTDIVVDLAWNEDGTRLATLDVAGTVDIWRVEGTTVTGETRFLTGVSALIGEEFAFNNAGDRVAIGAGDAVQVWDATTGQQLRELPVNFDTTVEYQIGAMAFSPNGELLAAGGFIDPLFDNAGNSVLVFDVASGEQLATLIGHDVVLTLAFNTQGNLLFSLDDDLMYVWGLPQ